MIKTELDDCLIAIGFQLAPKLNRSESNNQWIDIENTIHNACLEVESDSRLFLLLCSWVMVHGDYVIIEKLMKLQKKQNSAWLVALAIYAYGNGFHQYKRLIKKQKNKTALVDLKLTESLIEIKGAEDLFAKYGFVIAKNSIRVRKSDVLTKEQLIKKNIQYKNRYIFGASWRSDIVTAIEVGISSPYKIAKLIGCSYEPAYRIFKEYNFAKLV